MKELKLLQDICLSVYGVSLGDISLETFEHLDAILWTMNTVQTVFGDKQEMLIAGDGLTYNPQWRDCSVNDNIECCRDVTMSVDVGKGDDKNMFSFHCSDCGYFYGMKPPVKPCPICDPADDDLPFSDPVECSCCDECSCCEGSGFDHYCSACDCYFNETACPICSFETDINKNLLTEDCSCCKEEPFMSATICDKCGYTRLTKGSQLYVGCLCTLDPYWGNIVEVYCYDCNHEFASLAALIECPYCEGKQITLKLCQSSESLKEDCHYCKHSFPVVKDRKCPFCKIALDAVR